MFYIISNFFVLLYLKNIDVIQMREKPLGYWALSWLGLFSNIIALPIIAFIVIQGPPLKLANLSVAISIGWPSAIVGIVASAALLAERKWGITLTIISLSMILSGTFPYALIRWVKVGDLIGITGITLLTSFLCIFGLIYWCKPIHRKSRRF